MDCLDVVLCEKIDTLIVSNNNLLTDFQGFKTDYLANTLLQNEFFSTVSFYLFVIIVFSVLFVIIRWLFRLVADTVLSGW